MSLYKPAEQMTTKEKLKAYLIGKYQIDKAKLYAEKWTAMINSGAAARRIRNRGTSDYVTYPDGWIPCTPEENIDDALETVSIHINNIETLMSNQYEILESCSPEELKLIAGIV